VARRSEGGFGNTSDGGCGGAIEAHAVNISGTPTASENFSIKRVMRKKTDYQTARREVPQGPLHFSAISA